jgi:hypothetical protein
MTEHATRDDVLLLKSDLQAFKRWYIRLLLVTYSLWTLVALALWWALEVR